jgi:hypothetical protein
MNAAGLGIDAMLAVSQTVNRDTASFMSPISLETNVTIQNRNKIRLSKEEKIKKSDNVN